MGKSDWSWKRAKEANAAAANPDEARARYMKEVATKLSAIGARAMCSDCAGMCCVSILNMKGGNGVKSLGNLLMLGETDIRTLKDSLKALEDAKETIEGLIAQIEKEEAGRKWN